MLLPFKLLCPLQSKHIHWINIFTLGPLHKFCMPKELKYKLNIYCYFNWNGTTKRNVGICKHPSCDSMRVCLVRDYFCHYLPTSPNLGRICNYYFLHPPMCMILKLYSSIDKPPRPINCTYDQNLITNWCIMCIYGHDTHCTIKKSTYTIINIY
jgi:hypothetical protein